MPIRLYHIPNSRSARVVWMLEETGLDHELTFVAGDERTGAAHRERHPLGRVPVIEEEGGYVFESAAILLHLADLAPEAGLIGPLGSHERALAYQWVVFAMTELEANLIAAIRIKSSEPGDPAALELIEGRLREILAYLDGVLAGREWLQDGFTVGDVAVVSSLAFIARQGYVDGFDAVQAYIDRCEARPARVRALALGAAPA